MIGPTRIKRPRLNPNCPAEWWGMCDDTHRCALPARHLGDHLCSPSCGKTGPHQLPQRQPEERTIKELGRPRQNPWSRLTIERTGGGFLHYLDGRPVRSDTTLELRSADGRGFEIVHFSAIYDYANEGGKRVRVPMLATVEICVAGYSFSVKAAESMQFRWPVGSTP